MIEKEEASSIYRICLVCLGIYNGAGHWVYGPASCLHIYHKDCLEKWVAMGHPDCPVCRNGGQPSLEEEKKASEAPIQRLSTPEKNNIRLDVA
jgi:hypothetical protein